MFCFNSVIAIDFPITDPLHRWIPSNVSFFISFLSQSEIFYQFIFNGRGFLLHLVTINDIYAPGKTRQERQICPSQKHLPDNTQNTQETDIQAPGRIRTRNPTSEKPQTNVLELAANRIESRNSYELKSPDSTNTTSFNETESLFMLCEFQPLDILVHSMFVRKLESS